MPSVRAASPVLARPLLVDASSRIGSGAPQAARARATAARRAGPGRSRRHRRRDLVRELSLGLEHALALRRLGCVRAADLGYLCSTWAEAGDLPRGMLELSPVTREEGFATRAEPIARYEQRSGRSVTDIGWYETLALWKSAIFMEGNYRRALRGATDDPYLRQSGEAVMGLASRAEARPASR